MLKNKTSKMTDNEIILSELKNLYSIDIEYDSSNTEAFEMVLTDSSLLYQHKASTYQNDGFKIRTSSDSLIYENVTVNWLSERLSERYSRNLLQNANDQRKYDFKLGRTDFEGISNQLEWNYGIEVVPSDSYYKMINVTLKKL